jgi:hypothetical protein
MTHGDSAATRSRVLARGISLGTQRRVSPRRQVRRSRWKRSPWPRSSGVQTTRVSWRFPRQRRRHQRLEKVRIGLRLGLLGKSPGKPFQAFTGTAAVPGLSAPSNLNRALPCGRSRALASTERTVWATSHAPADAYLATRLILDGSAAIQPRGCGLVGNPWAERCESALGLASRNLRGAKF